VVVYNGEIYNFLELRKELEEIGHCFKTHTDTEVIVHAYEQWGDSALLRFNGMFAFSLWDVKKHRLLLARDRMGKKPLYWHFSKEGLIWGSEIKALLKAPWVGREINPLALHHYLTLQYAPDPLTFYQNIYSLPAAHKLVLTPRGEPVISRWWQLSFVPKWRISEAEAIEQAREILSASVRRRLISDVPLGAFLSGGIDSSIIVALMAENSATSVKTFSIGFEEPRYSETRYARMIAERYQTDHHEFIFRPDDLVNVIEGMVASFDQPVADPAALPLYELARQTRKHVTVALCGDGGDETLAGYQRYFLDSWLDSYARLPAWLTQKLVPSLLDFFPEPSWIPEDRNILTGLKRLNQFAKTTHKASLVRWGSYFTHEEKLALYSDGMKETFAEIRTEDWLADFYDQARATSLLDRTLSTDHVTYLSGDLLPKTDRMTMAHSLEGRSPFLDPEWIEWTARLPEKIKVRGLQTKWLLKASFKNRLPSGIVERGKQGFGVPVGSWLNSDLKVWSRRIIFETPALQDWFRISSLDTLFGEQENGRVNHGKRLWAILLFAMWLSNQNSVVR
jgi:asparagine synthase (glutamine-hydrolysing)